MSKSQIEDFQFWVLTLLSTKLFFRISEATGAKVNPDTQQLEYTGLTIDHLEPSS